MRRMQSQDFIIETYESILEKKLNNLGDLGLEEINKITLKAFFEMSDNYRKIFDTCTEKLDEINEKLDEI